MEQIYALGITCIEFVQEWFQDYETYLSLVNNVFSPGRLVDVGFPLLAVVDSVFAAQLLLCMSFGGWLNAISKWWLFEDRPYWWVKETTFYDGLDHPVLQQTDQTCETGPGSPSGHSTAAAMAMLLLIMWAEHITHDRKYRVRWWWKYTLYSLYVIVMCSIILARLYTAAHFPHQCFFGALVGSFLAPALCIYISDPHIWRYGCHARCTPKYILTRHLTVALLTVVVGFVINSSFLAPALCIYISDPHIWRYGCHAHCTPKYILTRHLTVALLTVVVGFVTYYGMIAAGKDPQATIKLAFRWCQNPESIHVSTTPIFSLVRCCGGLLGWALCVTPDVAKYRHYTKNRSLILSALLTVIIFYVYRYINDSVCTDAAVRYYVIQYMLSASEPAMYLRVVPYLSMWLFTGKEKIQ